MGLVGAVVLVATSRINCVPIGKMALQMIQECSGNRSAAASVPYFRERAGKILSRADS